MFVVPLDIKLCHTRYSIKCSFFLAQNVTKEFSCRGLFFWHYHVLEIYIAQETKMQRKTNRKKKQTVTHTKTDDNVCLRNRFVFVYMCKFSVVGPKKKSVKETPQHKFYKETKK